MKVKLGSIIAGHRIVKCLYTSQTGGAVYSAYNRAEREEKDNFAACCILANCLHWTCVLLPRRFKPNVKSADMIRADDLTFWEIKTSYSGNPKTISRALQNAKKQSRNAIVRIVAETCDIKAIERSSALRKRFSALESVILIRRNQVIFV